MAERRIENWFGGKCLGVKWLSVISGYFCGENGRRRAKDFFGKSCKCLKINGIFFGDFRLSWGLAATELKRKDVKWKPVSRS